jgi:hypothetical protein
MPWGAWPVGGLASPGRRASLVGRKHPATAGSPRSATAGILVCGRQQADSAASAHAAGTSTTSLSGRSPEDGPTKSRKMPDSMVHPGRPAGARAAGAEPARGDAAWADGKEAERGGTAARGSGGGGTVLHQATGPRRPGIGGRGQHAVRRRQIGLDRGAVRGEGMVAEVLPAGTVVVATADPGSRPPLSVRGGLEHPRRRWERSSDAGWPISRRWPRWG